MKIQPHELYPTAFLIGYRMIERMVNGTMQNQPQKVGTLITKGTFIDLDAPTPAAKEEQIPIFQVDVPFLIPNGDFKSPNLAPWIVENGKVEILEDEQGKRWAKLINNNPGSQESLRQTITSYKALAGRKYLLGFYGWAEAATQDSPLNISGIRLQSRKTGNSICQLSVDLTDQPQYFISEPKEWGDDETEGDFEVILPGSGDSNSSVVFSQIQVDEEGDTLRYESDFVPFKPNADVVILGSAEPPDGNTSHPWYFVLESSDGIKLEKEFSVPPINELPTRAIFGWAPRNQAPRLSEAGQYPEDYNPKIQPLPDSFDNLFFNGFDRNLQEIPGSSGSLPLSHFPDGTTFRIWSERRTLPPVSSLPFQVVLPSSRPTALLTVLNDSNQEQINPIPLKLDTVVIEPNLDRYTVVWRGNWEFEDDIKDRYLKLSITGG